MKSEKEKQVGLEKVDISFALGKLIFRIGEKEFYLDENTARFLFGCKTEIEFEKLSGLHETFEEFSTDDFLAKFETCWTHFGDAHEVAEFLHVDEKKLRRWIGESRGWRNDRLRRGPEIGNSIEKYRKELFPEITGERERPIKLNLKKVATMMKEGKKLNEIASELGEPWEAFIKSYLTNLDEIQKIMNKGNLEVISHE